MKYLTTLLLTCLLATQALACNTEAVEQADAADASNEGGHTPDVQTPGDPDVGTDAGTDSGTDAGTLADADVTEPNPPADPLACPTYPATQGTEVRLSPGQAVNLPQIFRDAAPNTIFIFEDGTYDIPNTLQVRAPGVTLRSASNDATKVIIDGRYEVNSLLFITASDVTVAHLTFTHAMHHPIHVTPGGSATENVTGTVIYGVRIIDGAQQFIKINGNGARTFFVDEGLVECSYFELTDAGRPKVDRSATGCYTGGVDAHGARDWVIRNNEFHDIYCAGEGLAEHAVHFWTGSRNTLVENNLIVNCARGVGFGLRENGEARTYDDTPYPGVEGLIGHYDGLIRNNVIFADHAYYDTGIELNQARGVKVYHNTIFTPDASGAYSSIDYRFANTDATIRNNLTARISVRGGASGTVDHNLQSIGPDLFVDAAALNFRLAETATQAIDQGIEVDEAGLDMDGQTRPRGAGYDLGAYEF